MGMNAIMLMNKGYGYWNDKDTMLPGYLTVVLTSVVIPVICCLLCGVIGLSPIPCCKTKQICLPPPGTSIVGNRPAHDAPGDSFEMGQTS